MFTANIFNTPIRRFEITDSAALGAAFRSAKSYYDLTETEKKWENILNKFLKFEDSIIIKPDKIFRELYDDMLELYRKCEDFILRNGEDPQLTSLKFIEKYFSL